MVVRRERGALFCLYASGRAAFVNSQALGVMRCGLYSKGLTYWSVADLACGRGMDIAADGEAWVSPGDVKC